MSRLGWLVAAVALTACSGDTDSGGGAENDAGQSGGGGGAAGNDAGQSGGGGGASASGGLGGAAASGGTGGSDAGADAALDSGPLAPWDTYCKAAQQQYAACGFSWDGCASSACVATVWDAAVLGDYTDCMLARPCSELGSDDECFSSAGGVDGGLSQSVQDKIDTCLAKVTACKSQGVSINFDSCGFAMPMVEPALSDQAMACFSGPCTGIDACLDPIRQKFDCLDVQTDAGIF